MKEYPDCFKACKDPNSKIVHSRPVRPTTPSSPSDPSAPALPAGSIALRPVEAVNSAFEDSLCLSSSISRYEGDFTDPKVMEAMMEKFREIAKSMFHNQPQTKKVLQGLFLEMVDYGILKVEV